MDRINSESFDHFNSVDPKQSELCLSGLTQQTGVALEDRGVLVIDNLDSPKELPDKLFPLVHSPIVLQVENKLQTLTGLSDLIKELRQHILDLSQLNDTFVNFFHWSQKKIITPINQEESKSFLEDKKSIINKYIKSQVRIKLLLQAIENLQEEDQEEYKLVSFQLKNWQNILDDILPNLSKDDRLKQLIETESQKQRGGENQELLRLQQLLSGERAGDNKEASSQLKKRVIGALLGRTSKQQQAEVQKDLVGELLSTATTINDIRLVDRLKKEGVNLLDLREKVKELRKQYETNPEQAEALNQEIIEQIAIPIANKIKKLFPHASDSSPTLIAAALYHRQAICAGKAEILVSIFRLLGLKAFNTSVHLTLDDDSNHAIANISLFADQELFIDANYSSKSKDYILKKEDNFAKILKKRVETNETKISPKSKVLVYSAQKINKQTFYNLDSHRCIALGPLGEEVYYQTSISYPHQIISLEQEAFFSATAHNNYAFLLKKLGKNQEAEEHYLEALRIDPNHVLVLNSYAGLLDKLGRNQEAEEHYLEALRLYPNYALVHYNYAILLEKLGRYEEAVQHCLEVLKLQPNDAWLITGSAALLQYSNRIKEALIWYQKALQIMQENPHQKNWLTKEEIEKRITDLEKSTS